jgi:hypothetical protein
MKNSDSCKSDPECDKSELGAHYLQLQGDANFKDGSLNKKPDRTLITAGLPPP